MRENNYFINNLHNKFEQFIVMDRSHGVQVVNSKKLVLYNYKALSIITLDNPSEK